MFLKKIVVNNVRNIKEAVLEPEENINLIVGENGSGKTSLLESIDILSRGRSFRSNKIAEVQRSENSKKGNFDFRGDFGSHKGKDVNSIYILGLKLLQNQNF